MTEEEALVIGDWLMYRYSQFLVVVALGLFAYWVIA